MNKFVLMLVALSLFTGAALAQAGGGYFNNAKSALYRWRDHENGVVCYSKNEHENTAHPLSCVKIK